MAESRQNRPKAPKSRQKAPKPVKHDDVPVYGISVHQVLDANDKTIGVLYRVAPDSGVRVIMTHELDGTIAVMIYEPSSGVRVV